MHLSPPAADDGGCTISVSMLLPQQASRRLADALAADPLLLRRPAGLGKDTSSSSFNGELRASRVQNKGEWQQLASSCLPVKQSFPLASQPAAPAATPCSRLQPPPASSRKEPTSACNCCSAAPPPPRLPRAWQVSGVPAAPSFTFSQLC